jgi:hypothetical protein
MEFSRETKCFMEFSREHENSEELEDNGYAAGEQARKIAMVRVRKPVYQVGAGRRRNREVTPPLGEFDRENL